MTGLTLRTLVAFGLLFASLSAAGLVRPSPQLAPLVAHLR